MKFPCRVDIRACCMPGSCCAILVSWHTNKPEVQAEPSVTLRRFLPLSQQRLANGHEFKAAPLLTYSPAVPTKHACKQTGHRLKHTRVLRQLWYSSSNTFYQARSINRFASMIGWYWLIADIDISEYFPQYVPILELFFKGKKNAWAPDLK